MSPAFKAVVDWTLLWKELGAKAEAAETERRAKKALVKFIFDS